MRTRIPQLLLVVLLVGLIWVMARPQAQAFPTPAVVTRAWQFDFRHAAPRPIAIKTPDGRIKWYWYITYKVVNNTGDERLFVPEVTVATDQGDIISTDRNVPGQVFEEVKKQVGNPLLESPIKVVGRMLQGGDYAKESVAIWPAFDHHVNAISIFVAGLSGETQVIQNPLTQDNVLVTKTLMIDYTSPGRAASPQDQPIVSAGERWVMR